MRLLVACLFVLATAAGASADMKPEEVGVIAMADSPTSRRLAEHYLQVRGVPADQLLLLAGKPGAEISRDDWENKVRPAIRSWLSDKGFEAKIRCLVTCGDVPLKVGRRSESSPVVAGRKEYLNRTRESRVGQTVSLIRLLDTLAPNEPPPAGNEHPVPSTAAGTPAKTRRKKH